jgi:hypothetical protein
MRRIFYFYDLILDQSEIENDDNYTYARTSEIIANRYNKQHC